jgi:HEAT repeat protein
MAESTMTDRSLAFADLTSDKASVREHALEMLANVPTPESLNAIADRLRQDKNANVRRRAAGVLGVIGLDGAVPILAAVLQRHDEELFIRAEAAAALGKIRHPDGVAVLGDALMEDGDDKVRWAAAQALRAVGGPRALEVLVRVLDAPGVSLTLRGFVAKALGDVGGVVAIARLQKTVSNDRHADVRKAALSALRTAANADSVR